MAKFGPGYVVLLAFWALCDKNKPFFKVVIL